MPKFNIFNVVKTITQGRENVRGRNEGRSINLNSPATPGTPEDDASSRLPQGHTIYQGGSNAAYSHPGIASYYGDHQQEEVESEEEVNNNQPQPSNHDIHVSLINNREISYNFVSYLQDFAGWLEADNSRGNLQNIIDSAEDLPSTSARRGVTAKNHPTVQAWLNDNVNDYSDKQKKTAVGAVSALLYANNKR